MKGDHYYWRLLATGACFVAFGLGGLAVGLVLFPLIAITPMSASTRKEIARRLIRRLFKLFIVMMVSGGVLRYSIRGTEHLGQGGRLIIANHPSLIDIVFLMSVLPTAGCIIKQALFRNPFTWAAVTSAGYISNVDANKMIDACVDELAGGYDLVVFPEGSRTSKGEKIAFKRGAARIAARARKPIVPVIITCRPSTLTKEEKWYSIPKSERPEFVLTFEKPLDTRTMTAETDDALQARQLTRGLMHYFEGRIST